ncbi:hypothetical protein [Terrabacter sp. BE26]|uniref:hypothetical protein n=1 Tax=Terrabacter sp. BE26 TaxID=2898152 RepID=UPI0035BE12F9
MRPEKLHLRRAVTVPVLIATTALLAMMVFLAPKATGAGTSPTTSTPEFSHPLDTDSKYFPLKPGMRFSYEGTVKDAEGTHLHQIVFVVTDLIKNVNGTRARVVLDRDYNDGELSEAELAFFAQDEADNVWTMGEYPEEYENGKFQGAPSTWIDGVRGAHAGILVPGRPMLGTPPFVQGRAPAIGFYDVGQVVARDLGTCVPTGCYSGVVKIKEWAPNAPEDGNQLKYYAPHVGLVRISAQGGDSQEVMVLKSLRKLSPAELRAARADALRLDHRAYQVSKDYWATGPAHRPR